ncbi:alcohol dehydrogenase [Cryptococcus neoformans Tu401-1]|nr:alcohol dehydrogenase [Cryptococcus neoformans var. grubii Bt85]OXG11787.1 alcohol dehydrogenase [Cryptococcus neoformans var. grubii Tu401-1]OXM76308.1 alcohol dehydrogenase [Cryptococcus neoformans var. grubii Bt63]
MKAAQIMGFETPYKINDIPKPAPQGNQILLRVKAAGFCHTDEAVKNGYTGARLPLTGGHEGAGLVEAAGGDVTNFTVGDKVAALLFREPCEECGECKNNRAVFCDNVKMNGFNVDGAFAEYMIVDQRFTLHVPKNIDFAQAAAFMCSGATVYNGLKAAKLPPKSVVGIYGIGALGSLGVQFAKAMGYQVIAIDNRPQPLRHIRTLGSLSPDLTFSSDHTVEEGLKAIEEMFPEKILKGVDAMLITGPQAHEFDYAFKMTAKHGVVVVLSCCNEPMIEIDWKDIVLRDVRVIGGFSATIEATKELFELASMKNVQSKIRTFSLNEINDLLNAYHQPDMHGKLVVTFD